MERLYRGFMSRIFNFHQMSNDKETRCVGVKQKLNGFNLSPGEWNSRLHKQSPPARTKEKSRIETHAGGFCLCRRGF
jgi:hypothetical protein